MVRSPSWAYAPAPATTEDLSEMVVTTMSQQEGFEASREARRATTAAGAARSARHEQWLAEAMAAAYYHELQAEQQEHTRREHPAEPEPRDEEPPA